MMYGYDAGVGLGGWLMMLGGIALVVGLVLVIIWAVGRTSGSASNPAAPAPGGQQPGAPPPDALEVLRMRFARGEMTADEYRAAKQTLEAK